MGNSINPQVFFVLVNYNGDSDTIECINSIQSIITYSEYKIIVVDNSPKLDSLQSLKEAQLENTILIRSNENRGFAAGCNLGILEAEKYGYDYIILLNNDTIIKSPDLVEELLICFEKDKTVGISGGKIYYKDFPDECWYSAGYLSPLRLRAKNRAEIEGICETPFITGCLQMISKSAINKVGLLCEDYFLCYEDADYCERMHKNGFKTVYNSNAQIFHKVSKSAPALSPISIYSSNRSRYIFIKRFRNDTRLIKAIFWIELTLKKIFYKNKKKIAIHKVIKELVEERIM